MSVIVKGMGMPEGCFFCEMCYQDQAPEHNIVSRCAAQEQMEIFPDKSIRDENCPLVEIKPHGRLIDADAFDERVRIAGGMADEELSDDFKDGIQTTLLLLKTQHTIIEAEEAEDGCKN